MITLPLHTKTKLACNCAPGHANCPYCEGEAGALPNLNRDALEAAIEILIGIGMKPTDRIETACLPDPAMPQGYRLCTSPLSKEGGAYLAEGESGGALLVLEDAATAARAGTTATEVKPGGVLEEIATAYIAMGLPPILWDR